ncbi:dipeptide epimerase [Rudanella paleaurantiibacter]|uniref:Dipeptide epimerase n=1 Tax=Rudanella paleaurantiibacter TaxID=2614655 RepID=A0A7J5U2N2_9BACT|nr:dipeptide epimerase [Rudanella paleaurantiibacter]KAB7732054.1 dipeptide epimerase [Rudanella paleaurantiibacter]
MKLFFHRFDLRLKHTFTIAHDSRDVQQTLVIELRDANGRRGFGEATANKYYGITIDRMVADLEAIRDVIEREAETHSAESFWALVHPYLRDNPFAQCALDEAMHDLVAKRAGVPLYQYWHLDPARNPITNYTIGIDTVEKMVAKMQELPWPLYKIKLGTPDDMAIVRELRKHTDARFRVDANCGWTAGQTIQFAPELKALNVEFIEQPLPADDYTGQARVFAESALPILADESCIVENDVDKCINRFHGVNIKLTKCGGLTPARRMIDRAKSAGMSVMVGCMTESSVGISAIAQLLPLLDYVDMDGTLLITNDPASGVTLDYGRVIYAPENGTGAMLPA